MIFRLLNIQGIAGIAAGLALLGLLLIQKVETRHWRRESTRFEQLYRAEQASFAQTVANYRTAAEQARAADEAAAERVATEQRAINERTSNDYEARLADARARASRVQQHSESPADRGSGGAAAVPGLSAAASGPAQAAGRDRLPSPDALTATEQAIQLDELIKWIRNQSAVDPNAKPK
jgi:hypothetical protein